MNFRLIRKRTEPAFVEPMRCNPVTTLTDLLGGESVLDGELVDFNSQGRPSLQLLQSNLSRTLPVYFYRRVRQVQQKIWQELGKR